MGIRSRLPSRGTGMFRRTLLAVALLPAVAFAQTTDCDRTITGYSCTTKPDGFRALGEAIAARRAQKAAAAQKKAAAEQFASAVADGRCDKARTLALQYGDARDVQIVASQCVTPQQRAEATLTSTVAAAVREGRCADAKDAALRASRLDLAEQAMRLCTPSTAQFRPKPELSPAGRVVSAAK